MDEYCIINFGKYYIRKTKSLGIYKDHYYLPVCPDVKWWADYWIGNINYSAIIIEQDYWRIYGWNEYYKSIYYESLEVSVEYLLEHLVQNDKVLLDDVLKWRRGILGHFLRGE